MTITMTPTKTASEELPLNTLDSTTLHVENPSLKDTVLKLSTETKPRQLARTRRSWTDDLFAGELSANNRQFSVSGGTLRLTRRWLLTVKTGTAVVQIFNGSYPFEVEILEKAEAEAGKFEWYPAEGKASYKLASGQPLNITLTPEQGAAFSLHMDYDYGSGWEDYASVYAKFVSGDASVQVTQQEQRTVARPVKQGSWGSRTPFKMLGIARSQRVDINDERRLVIESDTNEELLLQIPNINIEHALRSGNLAEDGSLTNAQIAKAYKSGEPLSYVSVVVSKNSPAVIEQLPR